MNYAVLDYPGIVSYHNANIIIINFSPTDLGLLNFIEKQGA